MPPHRGLLKEDKYLPVKQNCWEIVQAYRSVQIDVLTSVHLKAMHRNFRQCEHPAGSDLLADWQQPIEQEIRNAGLVLTGNCSVRLGKTKFKIGDC